MRYIPLAILATALIWSVSADARMGNRSNMGMGTVVFSSSGGGGGGLTGQYFVNPDDSAMYFVNPDDSSMYFVTPS